MAVTFDILRTYRAPRQVMRRLMAGGPREDRALAYLMAACLLIFVGQWPRLQREAILNPEGPPLDMLVGGALLGWLFLAPLFFYGVAALSHLIARLVGGRGTWSTARLALFWALLATAPLVLLYGLVAGFVGPGPALDLTGAITALAFGLIWVMTLWESERPAPDHPTGSGPGEGPGPSPNAG